MNHIMEENNQNLSDLQRAGMLRKEAELLESRERIRGKLRQLMEMSRDPEYDKYIAQMLKDNGVIKYPWLFKLYCDFTDSNDSVCRRQVPSRECSACP